MMLYLDLVGIVIILVVKMCRQAFIVPTYAIVNDFLVYKLGCQVCV